VDDWEEHRRRPSRKDGENGDKWWLLIDCFYIELFLHSRSTDEDFNLINNTNKKYGTRPNDNAVES
jgi:hypothetical protein